MATLPVLDAAGNALAGFRSTAELWQPRLDARIPMPFALVVVTFADRVLMVFDRWRAQWELPGGMREPGETARRAAVRELHEETGIVVTDLSLDLAAVAECVLHRPRRREYGAIFRCALGNEPELIVNDEVADFRWWDPRSPRCDDMSPIDAEIANRVFG